MIWLLALVCALLFISLLARIAAHRASRRAGLPSGTLLYSDTGMPVGRIAPVTVSAEGLKQERPLRSERFGLVGRPDYLIKTEQGIIPVEVKSASCPPDGRPYDSHIAQLAAYCLLVEDTLDAAVPYGIIRYRDRELRVDYTDEMRNGIITLLDEINAARRADDVHRSHEDARRCRGCSMREVCTESLADTD
jgi:CRISPR-associated exonuclease Cas4